MRRIRRLVGMTAASTPEIEADRQALIGLINDEAVFHGDFTLSSESGALVLTVEQIVHALNGVTSDADIENAAESVGGSF